ncbi:hypothetical protein OHA21_07380 [Actinoplanes sp. NBC_00393]|uniref:hypothetical protein n=1 Tax=Actinoplanes sp. NBC_00393 TaxID=2975953 RepID=UPI002E21753D
MLTRPWGARPVLVPGALAAVLLAGCTAAPAPFDVVDPAWSRARVLEVSWVADQSGEPAARVRTVLTLDADGRVSSMDTAEVSDGVVAYRGAWSRDGGTSIAEAPGCAAETDEVDVPDRLPALLAEAFGPVDAATTDGWTVTDGVASRPGPGGDTVESVPLAPLHGRALTETENDTGRVVARTRDITVRTLATAPALPACGAAA